MKTTRITSLFISLLIAVFGGLALSQSSIAADGSSGCGAGWYVFQKNSLVSSTLRGTTNALFFNQTFGMTFGTSNCSQHSIVQNDKEALYFAEANNEVLNIEMAEGQGEHLAAFAKTFGCDDASIPAFQNQLKQNYAAIYPATQPAAHDEAHTMYKNVKSQIRSDFVLAAHCNRAVI